METLSISIHRGMQLTQWRNIGFMERYLLHKNAFSVAKLMYYWTENDCEWWARRICKWSWPVLRYILPHLPQEWGNSWKTCQNGRSLGENPTWDIWNTKQELITQLDTYRHETNIQKWSTVTSNFSGLEKLLHDPFHRSKYIYIYKIQEMRER